VLITPDQHGRNNKTMARGRMLNKSISLSEKFAALPDDTCRLLATWTIPQLDMRGVFYGDPVTVRALIFPMRENITSSRVRGYMIAMHEAGLIQIFESDGRYWQSWPGFADNQVGLRSERENTEYPEPPEVGGNLPDNFRQTSGKLPPISPQKVNLNLNKKIKGKGKGNDGAFAPRTQTSQSPISSTDSKADTFEAVTTTPAIVTFNAEAKAETPTLETPKKKTAKPPAANMDNPAVVMYRDLCHVTPNDIQRQLIADHNPELAHWELSIKEWLAHGWNKANVPGMLERYESPTAAFSANGHKPNEPAGFAAIREAMLDPRYQEKK
jgi:hypothetical protein